ncbi:MAG: DsbA family protein [Thermoleophilia bacterium]
MSDPITIDIWSDIACPWCYIGKRRLQTALDAFAARAGRPEVAVRFHSFELAPDVPVDFDGGPVEFLTARKGMSREQVEGMLAHVTALAAGEGLDFDFGAVKQTRTVLAHQLLHHAAAEGLQEPMKERLMRAHFVEGRHVGHAEDLADLAAEVGLDRDEVLRRLEAGTHAADVEADLRQAAQYGIGAVPFYVIDGRYGISGAQLPGTFLDALEQAAEDRVTA